MDSENTALWLPARGKKFEVGPAPVPEPGDEEVVVRVRAVAVNFLDTLPGYAYRFVLPWVRFPMVIGTDVAGEVVAVGRNVSRLSVGERVLGHAVGVEKSRNRPAEGAFQHLVVLMQHLVAPIPGALAFEQAAVLPLALSTAATGLFQSDHLGLPLPTSVPTEKNSTVLVWGASTSVGINAVQLARSAGYRVVATASPRNHDWVRSVGAAEVVDYRSKTVVAELLQAIGGQPLAGTVAIGSGSLPPAVKVARRAKGTRKVASAHPDPVTRLRAWRARRKNVQVSAIWGASLKDNEVGPAIYTSFLPQALASNAYRAEPRATVVGHGLTDVPNALELLREGVSGEKLVVTI
ncbi:zinc-binding alcohol dehydrogenase family protein [Kineosporia rhizophila]|uniref:zinc-binding alcohol dehydrogenase family protein n=1 Tax=Kineosporia rhizophila TaxID=84633 RepID=UPI001E566D81|nr:zinc-binding alcohol dehydrogenase family protein [Kineosporia rhizophila]